VLNSGRDRAARWFVFPRFREEGPPRNLASFMALRETEGETIDDLSLKRLAYLVLLGYRPATVSGIVSVLLENKNRAMYGSELGKALEAKFDLPRGWYTKARYYEDRLERVLRILSELGSLRQEEVKVLGTERVTAGYRLSDSLFQLTSHGTAVEEALLEADILGGSKTFKICKDHDFVAADPKAKHCLFCGKVLVSACLRCGKPVSPHYEYCVGCGEALLSKTS